MFIRAQVVIPYDTGLPRDVITNTLYFETATPAGLVAGADELAPMLTAFYETIYDVSNRAASHIAWAGAYVNFYDMADPEPRPPYTVSMPITAQTGTSALPAECALVLSFNGGDPAGVPRARQRGRIYLGGWGALANTASPGRPSSGVITDVISAATQLLADVSGGTDTIAWCVYSATAGNVYYPIVGGWVDDAWDTQRRRGVSATSRTTW